MKLSTRRVVSLLLGLTLLPIVSVLSAASASIESVPQQLSSLCKSSAYQCTIDGYGPSISHSSWAWQHYGGIPGISPSAPHNCTLYAAWMLEQFGLTNDPGNWGNARDWGTRTQFPVSMTPSVGAIAWYEGRDHVGFVAAVNSNSAQVLVIADNFIGDNIPGYTSAGWVAIDAASGYIHVPVVESTFANGFLERLASGESWALTGGAARPIQNGGTFICAEYRDRMPIVPIAQFYLSVESPFACKFDGTVVQAAGGSAYWVSGNDALLIPSDLYSLSYYESRSPVPLIVMPARVLASVLEESGHEPAGLLAKSLPPD
ncbi:MAG: CHAP domain-containing protein, partial [Dehalococcoidales bacterium]